MPATHSTRVNVLSAPVNAAKIKKETLNGREVYRVPSATMPDNITMNGIFYSAEEIEKSFMSLERTPAPLGHPILNDRFLSASDPEALHMNYVGAFNANVRRENGRVFLDKIVDIETANQTDRGKRLLEALDNGEAVHTSTGLLCNLDKDSDGVQNAKDILFDHDAILLDEEGAATPDQGVGMMVNGKEITVINSVLEQAEDNLDYATSWLVDALERHEKAGLVDRFKETLISLFRGEQAKTETSNEEDDDMTDKVVEALSAKVDALTESVGGIAETIANAVTAGMKPLTDRMDAADAVANEQAEAEKSTLVNKIVKANLLDEDTAKTMNIMQLNALAEKCEPGKASTFKSANNSGDEGEAYVAEDYDPNSSASKGGE